MRERPAGRHTDHGPLAITVNVAVKLAGDGGGGDGFVMKVWEVIPKNAGNGYGDVTNMVKVVSPLKLRRVPPEHTGAALVGVGWTIPVKVTNSMSEKATIS